MLSFFLNKQQQTSSKQDNSKRSLDKVVANEHTRLLEKQDLNKIEGGNTSQHSRLFPDRISLDDFFSGPVPQ